ncbi:hypothetical protein SOPP22_07785 [Shewanella sp. OPT22]|nr:hypothetical protein SOPP22_07785 [Shewanella sp. OPT22]
MRSIPKKITLPLAISKLLMTVAIVSCSTVSSVNAGDVDFTINGIKQSDGAIYVALFKGEENYRNNLPYRAQQVNPSTHAADISFSRLPEGEYVIRYFHDQNSNQKMDMNLFGMPTEGFGYSNNAQPDMGPAKYQQMAFQVLSSGTVHNQSQVIYP